MTRRRVLQSAARAVALLAAPRFAWALDYPARPVRIVVGFAAGTSSDITARIIAQWLTDRLGAQFVVENRTGAGTNIAADFVAHAPPDGHTLLWVTHANTINATLYHKLNFDFARDIEPVASVMRLPAVLVVVPSVPAKTVPEFIAYAKANPGKINYASSGIGTGQHVAGELFKMMTGVDLVHVPYRGVFYPDLLSGQVQATFNPIPSTLPYIKAGQLRALAVTTATRHAMLPDVPAMAEFVPGYEATLWFAIGAPKGTPAEIVDRLNREINAALADPKVQERLADLGGTPLAGSPGDLRKLIADEIAKWAKVIKFANMKAD